MNNQQTSTHNPYKHLESKGTSGNSPEDMDHRSREIEFMIHTTRHIVCKLLNDKQATSNVYALNMATSMVKRLTSSHVQLKMLELKTRELQIKEYALKIKMKKLKKKLKDKNKTETQTLKNLDQTKEQSPKNAEPTKEKAIKNLEKTEISSQETPCQTSGTRNIPASLCSKESPESTSLKSPESPSLASPKSESSELSEESLKQLLSQGTEDEIWDEYTKATTRLTAKSLPIRDHAEAYEKIRERFGQPCMPAKYLQGDWNCEVNRNRGRTRARY